MKKFKFRLQSILNLKEQEEKKIQKELARLQKEHRLVKEDLENYNQKKAGYQNKLLEEEAEAINLDYAINCRNYIDYLSKQIDELLKKLSYWEKKISECREKLLDKTKEKKMLNKLKERKHDAHWQEFIRQEQKENDEIALNSFNNDNVIKLNNSF